ncbi:MAG: CHASE2 domain-containing protein [Cytophagales bacterium]|nr:CHASE2 domain-containing protein [Cytophagales bacterium]
MKLYIKRFFRKKHLFHIDNIISMVVLFLFFKLLGSIQLSVLDPIGDALGDVELTDIVFSQFNKNGEYHAIQEGEPTLDTNVVIVNIGNESRGSIAIMLSKINQCEPSAVGIDCFFDKSYRAQTRQDSMVDNFLAMSFQNTKNLVLVSGGAKGYENINGKIQTTNYKPELNQYPNYKTSDFLFSQHATNGLANLVTDLKAENEENEFKVCRKMLTHAKIKSLNDTVIESFALSLVSKHDSNKANIFRKRIDKKPAGKNKAEEIINYTGNIYVPFQNRPKPRYRAFDVSDIQQGNFTKEDFEGKIVLMGFLGGNINIKTGEDKFFTPLNERYIGKTNEDMYGVVIHANAITMIMQELYIDSTPKWIGHVIGIILTFFCVGIFRSVYFEYKHWYDGITKVLGVIFSMILLFVIGLVFASQNIKITFPAMYFVAIVLAGDLLEIYYGLLKNIYFKLTKQEITGE